MGRGPSLCCDNRVSVPSDLYHFQQIFKNKNSCNTGIFGYCPCGPTISLGTYHVKRFSSRKTSYVLSLCFRTILSRQAGQLHLAWNREIQSSFAILNYILDVWKCLSCHAGVVGYSQLARDAVSHSMLPKAAPLLSSPPPGRKSDPKCNSAKIEEHYYSGTLFVF